MTTLTTAKTPTNLSKHFEIIESENINLDEFFCIQSAPFKEKFLRTYASPVAAKMPPKMRFALTGVAKRLRNPNQELTLRYPLDFVENQVLAERLSYSHLRPWWGKRAVVCVCHDVDNAQGFKFVPTMMEVNYRHNLAATFNFLTHDEYRVNRTLMDQLKTLGFEIGLHGDIHDQGFAFREEKVIKEGLSRSLQVLEDYDVVGYRSPALSLSDNLFHQIKAHNIRYDSSLQIGSPFYHSVRVPYPVYMEKYGLWELPLMIQDDNYFRDTQSSDEKTLSSIRRYVNETIQLNGVCVINMHPHLMAKRPDFYERFVKTIKAFDDIATATMREVIDYATSNHNNK